MDESFLLAEIILNSIKQQLPNVKINISDLNDNDLVFGNENDKKYITAFKFESINNLINIIKMSIY